MESRSKTRLYTFVLSAQTITVGPRKGRAGINRSGPLNSPGLVPPALMAPALENPRSADYC
jgi:hypothetical protein